MHPFRAISLITASSLLLFGATPAMASSPTDESRRNCKPSVSAEVVHLGSVKTRVTAPGLVGGDTEPEATATAEPTPTPTPTPTAEPSPEPSPSVEPSVSPTPTVSPTPEPVASDEPTAAPTTPAEPVRSAAKPAAMPVDAAAEPDAMPMKWCWNSNVTITITNVTTGVILHREDLTREWWFHTTTWERTVEVGPGQTVRVKAEQGRASNSAEATTPNVPGTPQNFVAGVINPRSATLIWAVPTHDGGRPVTHYEVGAPGRTHRVEGRTWKAEGLEPNHDYTFVVAAANVVGRSDFVTYSLHTPVEPKVPSAPRDLRGNNDGAFAVDLDWVPPADSGGLTIEGYRVTWGSAHDSGEGFTTNTSLTVRGLAPATAYTFSVVARNQLGYSPKVTITKTTGKPQPRPKPEPPSEPRDLRQSGGTHTSVTLTWERPDFAGNGTYLRYRVRWNGERIQTSDLGATLADLATNTPVDVSVEAYNEAGHSDAVQITAYPTMDPVKPTAPQPPVNPAVTRLGGPSATDQSLLVSWDPPSFDGRSPVTGYEVTWAPTQDPERSRTDSVTGTSFVASGLTGGTEYSFSIVAKNAVGPSSPVAVSGWTNLVPIVDRVPAAATDVRRVSGTTTELVMAWNPPADTGSGPVLAYIVQWHDPGSPVTHAAYCVDPEIVITGLTAGTEYTVEVFARNYAGLAEGATATVRTNMDPIVPQAPSVPRNLGVTGTTTTSIALSWKAPASSGDAPVTGYVVRVTGLAPMLVDAPSALITGLVPDRAYTIDVSAANVFGESAAATVSARTAAAPPGPGPTPGPAPQPVPFTPDKPGGNTDGSLDLDLRERTVRQTLPGTWPARLTILSGQKVTLAPANGMITNAKQTAKVRATYRSKTIRKVAITRDPRTKAYVLRAYLKPWQASGVIVVTITAPAVNRGGTQYEPLQISQRFLVKAPARR